MENIGPSWQTIISICGTIITLLIGIVVSLVAAYAKGLGSRIQVLERDHRALNDLVLSQYHNKSEVNQQLKDIKESVQALHSRFDLMITQHKE